MRELALEDPALFLELHAPPVLIDEIQYAPSLLPSIKMVVDQTGRTGGFWLTGSQQFRLMKGLSETLAGRAGILHLLGLSMRERHHRPTDIPPLLPGPEGWKGRSETGMRLTHASLFHGLWMGGFPALVAGPARDRDLFFSSYLQTYLERDVRDLAQVGNRTSFLRFVRACAARTAQMLNLSELARDADVSVPTARNWLSILEASLLVMLVQPYHSNLTRRLIKTPKLYFLDTGLCAYLTAWSSPASLSAGAMAGAMFETHVLGELMKGWWGRARTPELFYFRNKDGREIDFVLIHDRKVYAIEAKASASPKRDWAAAFSSLSQTGLEMAYGSVVCLCRERVPLGERIDAIPVGWM
jgi:predicted AAA+ superfamily ATPase